MPHNNQTSPTGFLSLKLPPPPCVVLLVQDIENMFPPFDMSGICLHLALLAFSLLVSTGPLVRILSISSCFKFKCHKSQVMHSHVYATEGTGQAEWGVLAKTMLKNQTSDWIPPFEDGGHVWRMIFFFSMIISSSKTLWCWAGEQVPVTLFGWLDAEPSLRQRVHSMTESVATGSSDEPAASALRYQDSFVEGIGRLGGNDNSNTNTKTRSIPPTKNKNIQKHTRTI